MKLTDSKFKLETLLLRGLFVACMVICGLFLTSMVTRLSNQILRLISTVAILETKLAEKTKPPEDKLDTKK